MSTINESKLRVVSAASLPSEQALAEIHRQLDERLRIADRRTRALNERLHDTSSELLIQDGDRS